MQRRATTRAARPRQSADADAGRRAAWPRQHRYRDERSSRYRWRHTGTDMIRRLLRWFRGRRPPFVYEVRSDDQVVRLEAPTLDGLARLIAVVLAPDTPAQHPT